MDYYDRLDLTDELAAIGFDLVGYGCTTCIGNSGPLPAEISQAVNDADLTVAAVLSGNRNFEGRINPDVKLNYLASPPLVVAYALAGTMNWDPGSEPLGTDSDGQPVMLADIWPDAGEVAEAVARATGADSFTSIYDTLFDGDDRWRAIDAPTGDRMDWDGSSTYVRQPPYFEGLPVDPAAADRHHRRPGPGPAGRLGHHRPHLPRRQHQGREPGRPLPPRPRRREGRLQLLRLPPGQPRGDDPGHLRQHPAPQPAPPRLRGRRHQAHPVRRGHGHLRRVGALPGRRHAAGGPGRQGVRLGLVPGLGGQGHGPARRPGRHRPELRAHPPVEPDRHGRAAAPVLRRRLGRVPGPHRRGGALDRRALRPRRRRRRPRRPSRSRPARSPSPPRSGSTPRPSRPTTATAACSPTSSAASTPAR